MNYILNIWDDPYGEGFRTTEPKQVTLEEGLTVLVGCNGSGKTTFLQNLEEQIKKEDIPYTSYNNLIDGGTSSYNKLVNNGDFRLLATLVNSSEGENINIQLSQMAGYLYNFLITGETPKSKRKKELDSILKVGVKEKLDISNKRFILLDAIDSGFSIDNIVSLKEDLFKLIFEDARARGIELYIIASANEYELVKGENCLDVISGKYITFKDYEDYYNFILDSRKRKDKRRDNRKLK